MSIWGSVSGEPVVALDGHDQDAHYSAKGTPSIELDVATATAFHDHIRLALWNIDEDGGFAPGLDLCALLCPDNARRLIDKLATALKDTTETVGDT